MSGKQIKTFYDERRGKWRLLWGNETFYNELNQMIEFDSEKDALEFTFAFTWIGDVEVIGSEVGGQ